MSVRVRPLSPEDAKSSPWRISDRIFEEECRTLEIYKAQAENIVSAAIQGFNVWEAYEKLLRPPQAIFSPQFSEGKNNARRRRFEDS